MLKLPSICLLLIPLVVILLLVEQSQTARAAVALPAYGSFYVDGSTVVAPGAGENDDPFHDIANDCNFNYPFFNPFFPDLINYISILPDGTMYGECRYTDQYSNVTETENSVFGGTLNAETGVFSNIHVSSTLRFVLAGDPTTTTTTYNITYDIASGAIVNGFAQGTANFTFAYSCSGGCGDITSRGYSGTVKYLFSLKPANDADLSIDHIEIVQVTQDVNNGVPLVAHKSIMVRVFPHANAIVLGTKVKLTHNGQEIGSATLDASPDSPGRESLDDSGNFLLPAELTDAGALTLQAEIMPPDGYSDVNEANDTKSVNVTFQDRGGLFVDYIKVCHQPGGTGQPNCPHGDVNSMHLFAQDILPLADNALIYERIVTPVWIYTGPLTTFNDESAFIAALRKRYDFGSVTRDPNVTPSLADQVMAWMPQGLSISGGASDPKWLGGQGRVFYLQRKEGEEFELALQVGFAHEIAHNLGRHHPKPGQGGCNTVADPDSDWPYGDPYLQEVGFWVGKMMIMKKGFTDLMAACDQPWISPFTYGKLFDGNFSPQSVSVQGTASNFLVVSGAVDAGGASGTLDPAYQLQGGGPASASNPDGNTCLEFAGDSGALGNFCFDLNFATAEGEPLTRESFALKVVLPVGTSRVALTSGGAELDALESSAAAPTLDITEPQQGESWTGEQAIRWNGSDSDGNPLLYTILASYDGGANWVPIEVDTPSSEFSFDTGELGGGEVLFRVLVSDGLNTAEETVGPVTIASPFKWGDADCGGTVNIGDAINVARFTIGIVLQAPAGCPTLGQDAGGDLWGDVDCGGTVNIGDAINIARFTIGIVLTPPVGCRTIGL